MRFKLIILLLILGVAFTLYLLPFTLVKAQDCGTDLQCQIDALQREYDALSPAQEKNKQDLASLRNQLSSLDKKIVNFSNLLKKTEIEIRNREEDSAYAKEVFEEKAINQYIRIRNYDPGLLIILSADSATGAFREINFRQRAADEDRKTMDEYGQNLLQLKKDKDTLEKNKQSLTSIKKQVAEKEKFLAGEVAKVEGYLSSLTAKQNELAALKSGGFQTSIGDTPPTLEPCSGAPGSSNYCDPGFRPAFAAFSFGAPHRTGLSQYGAYGRSKSGQSAEQILSAYFQGAELKKDYAVPSTIGVSGYGRISFEDNYLLGIYEVPESWGNNGGFEALKAQAVAARSYALSATNNGSGTICASESCQVYKPQLKSGKWKEAVNATRGWVIIKGGSPAPTYYSASTGGYTISQWGWNGIKDTSGDWPSGAYEKIGSSPWFYKGWYKSRGGATCNRANPWLTSGEMADILNSWKVLYGGANGDKSRIVPVSCWGGNPYSKDELIGLGGFTSVSGISVIYSNSGFTQTVILQTNNGNINIAGEEFKKAFNLRAPGYTGIKSSLYNLEKL